MTFILGLLEKYGLPLLGKFAPYLIVVIIGALGFVMYHQSQAENELRHEKLVAARAQIASLQVDNATAQAEIKAMKAQQVAWNAAESSTAATQATDKSWDANLDLQINKETPVVLAPACSGAPSTDAPTAPVLLNTLKEIAQMQQQSH
jgi:hypothetical protein